MELLWPAATLVGYCVLGTFLVHFALLSVWCKNKHFVYIIKEASRVLISPAPKLTKPYYFAIIKQNSGFCLKYFLTT